MIGQLNYYNALQAAKTAPRFDADAKAQRTRILADGGSISLFSSLNSFIVKAKELNMYDSNLMAIDAKWGVKKDGANAISKIYTAYGDAYDWAQTNGALQALFSATAGESGGPAIVAGYNKNYNFSNFVFTKNYNYVFVKCKIGARRIDATFTNFIVGSNNNNAYLRITHDTGVLVNKNLVYGGTNVVGSWLVLGGLGSNVNPNGAVYVNYVDDSSNAASNWVIITNISQAFGTTLEITTERLICYASDTAISISVMQQLMEA